MNVVMVRHERDAEAKWYAFGVPGGMKLSKGLVVMTEGLHGKQNISVCVTDSEEMSENAVNMLMKGDKITGRVVGIYMYNDVSKRFDDGKDKET